MARKKMEKIHRRNDLIHQKVDLLTQEGKETFFKEKKRKETSAKEQTEISLFSFCSD